jgi:hypothetical protein
VVTGADDLIINDSAYGLGCYLINVSDVSGHGETASLLLAKSHHSLTWKAWDCRFGSTSAPSTQSEQAVEWVTSKSQIMAAPRHLFGWGVCWGSPDGNFKLLSQWVERIGITLAEEQSVLLDGGIMEK